MNSMHLKLYFDGSVTKNPGGVAGFGWVLIDDAGQEVHRNSGIICEGEEATNNIAEWGAVRDGLRYLYNTNWQGELEVIGDSQLVIRQLQGEYKCRKDTLIPFYRECMQILENFIWSASWVDRKQNTLADSLSRVKKT